MTTGFVRFTLAHWCVLVAALLPLLSGVIAKWGRVGVPRKQGGYDNEDPRAWLANQGGWRARANAAQANGFEGLPLFIGAVVIALQLGAPQTRLDVLAFLYVVMRMIYIMMYVSGMATFRSIAWSLAFAVNLGIFFVGYR